MGCGYEKLKSSQSFEALALNLVKSFGGEYVDDERLKDMRWDVFMALSEIRKYEFLFYPFKPDSSCVIFGDRYGAFVGSLCVKLKSVVSVLPSGVSRLLAERRFGKRRNFKIVDSESAIPNFHASFDYAVVNLEIQGDWALQDLSELSKLLVSAINSLKGNGVLFLSLPATKCREALSFLCSRGPFIFQIHDPFGNGFCLIEATLGGALAAEGDLDWSSYKRAGYFRSPLLDSKWVRDNDIPFWTQDARDQDYEKIQAVKKIQIDLLKKLAEVCSANGLALYPIYGTLLGLMRNGCFIDGDDDIDVAMPRKDYDKLLSLGAEFFGQYFLQTPQSDDCFFGGYAKLRNVQTTAIHPQNWWANCCEGIFIDIFPIDKAFSSAKKERRKLKRIRFLQRLLFAYSYGTLRDFLDMKLLKWKFHKYFGKLFNRSRVVDAFDSCLKAGDSKSRLAIYAHYRSGSLSGIEYFSADDFSRTFKMDFEGVPLDIPCGWNRLLQSRYGEGFLDELSFNEWKIRHAFYDTNVPYGVWKRRFGGLKNPESIKEPVIFFGDGSVFKACLSYYKSRLNVRNMVLLPGEEKVAESVCGVPILSFEEFTALNIPRQSFRGVICSGDALAADSLLSQKGLDGLYIFWHDRNWMLFANQSAVWKTIRCL